MFQNKHLIILKIFKNLDWAFWVCARVIMNIDMIPIKPNLLSWLQRTDLGDDLVALRAIWIILDQTGIECFRFLITIFSWLLVLNVLVNSEDGSILGMAAPVWAEGGSETAWNMLNLDESSLGLVDSENVSTAHESRMNDNA